jgi:hypothetical protein
LETGESGNGEEITGVIEQRTSIEEAGPHVLFGLDSR